MTPLAVAVTPAFPPPMTAADVESMAAAPPDAGATAKVTTPPSTGSIGLLAVTVDGQRVGERLADDGRLARAAGHEGGVEPLALEGTDVDAAAPREAALVGRGHAVPAAPAP